MIPSLALFTIMQLSEIMELKADTCSKPMYRLRFERSPFRGHKPDPY